MTITFSKIKSLLKSGLNLIWETFRLRNYRLNNLLNNFNLAFQFISYVLIDFVFLFTQRIKLLNKEFLTFPILSILDIKIVLLAIKFKGVKIR